MKTSAKLKQEHIFQRAHINDHIMTLSLCATCMCDCLICGSPVVPCQPSLPSAPFPRASLTTFNIHVVSRVCVCVCEVPCAVLLNLLAKPCHHICLFFLTRPTSCLCRSGDQPGDHVHGGAAEGRHRAGGRQRGGQPRHAVSQGQGAEAHRGPHAREEGREGEVAVRVHATSSRRLLLITGFFHEDFVCAVRALVGRL